MYEILNNIRYIHALYDITLHECHVQGGSNMTGTNCD